MNTTAGISSSRSPDMSSNQCPSTPPAPPSEVLEVEEDYGGQSTTGVGSEATDDTIDNDFLDNHLRLPVAFLPTNDMFAWVDKIKTGGNSTEKGMYQPAASLLTCMSKALFDTLPQDQKDRLRERHSTRQGRSEHLTFIDHHATAPTHFPGGVLCSVNDAPDLLGVYNVDDFQHSDGVYSKVPHHRVEAIVEAKPQSKGGRRPQAVSYAYRHHQARPDHPALYCLVLKPQWYQIIVSDPNGIVASPQTAWSDLRTLAAYIYSHYFPPRNHFLVDESITWSPGQAPDDPPMWSIAFKEKVFTGGRFIFIGTPWGRRTTVFRASLEDEEDVAIKEGYLSHNRRFKEEDVLNHIHADGDVPGVVRLRDADRVTTRNKTLQIGSKEEKALRTKERLVFWDLGERLVTAESVNDLLEALYDALEVHRTVLMKRQVLHRDMSIYNILMYPKWRKLEGRRVMEDAPPLIQDVLAGQNRPLEDRTAACLLIDADNAAILEEGVNVPSDELMHRTGTPTYIARGVCLGMVMNRGWTGYPMPELKGDALRLYLKAHGEARYERYNDKDGTCHGGSPPKGDPTDMDDSEYPPFFHRPEHDVESIYWSMVSALLRARPVSAPMEKYASEEVAIVWDILNNHAIPDNPKRRMEKRHEIIESSKSMWVELFTPEMRDVAVMLSDISKHVRSEYALWTGDVHPDHLHEAVQRIILQYLVDHRDNLIPLDPENQRPTKRAPPKVRNNQLSTQTSASGSGTPTGSAATNRASRPRGSQGGRRATGARQSMRKGVNPGTSIAIAGPSTGSKRTRERATANIQAPIVAGPKRKSDSQRGRNSKRRKGAAGTAVATQDDDDIEED